MSNNSIIFNEKDHSYKNKVGETYISVSQLIGKYKQDFDPKGEVIERCAKRDGITVSELRGQWDKERDDSIVRGKSAHRQMEHWIKTGEILDDDYKDIIQQISKFPFKGKLKSEQIIFSDRFRIAGTIDVWEDLGHKQFSLYDLKSNKAIKQKSFFSTKTKQFQMMKYPIEHVLDSNWWHYQLQLSLYALILEDVGWWVKNLYLFWIQPKKREVMIYPVTYMRDEALKIISHYNKMKEW